MESDLDAYGLQDPFEHLGDYCIQSKSQEMGKVAIESLMSDQSLRAKQTIEQDQPRYLEEVHKFNSSSEQRICVQRFPDNFVFSMV